MPARPETGTDASTAFGEKKRKEKINCVRVTRFALLRGILKKQESVGKLRTAFGGVRDGRHSDDVSRSVLNEGK